MSFNCYSSPVKITDKDKQWIQNSLQKFQKQPLSKISIEQLKQSNKLYKKIHSSHSHVFIFAFGGISASFKTAQSFFSLKYKKAVLVDKINESFKKRISQMTQRELELSHFVFISKSGHTKEILFYKKLLKQLYAKNELSLKNRLTLLTQNLSSPLLSWGQKESAHIEFLKDTLPGRFSFFSLSGFFQFQVCGLRVTSSDLLKSSHIPLKALNFFLSQFYRKEIFFCFFQPEWQAVSRWLEMSWSESLFKEGMKKQLPLLRAVGFSDLRHGFIEELAAKKKQVCFWALDVKRESLQKKKLKAFLKTKKIPYLFMEAEKKPGSFYHLIMAFYQILFLAGEFSGANIYSQTWVDYLKK